MASGGPAEINSGFNLKHRFSKHSATVSVVIHNATNGTYLSLDDRGARVWDMLPGPGHGQLKSMMFPKAERGFLSRVIYVPAVRLYFAAALDMTVQVYDSEFQLQQSVPSGQRSVLCLSFDSKTRELISAGIDGVKIWRFDRSHLRNTGRRGPMEAKDYCLVERLRVDNFRQTLVSRAKLQEDARQAERENEFSTELMSETSVNFLKETGADFTELLDANYGEWASLPAETRGAPPPKPVRVELSTLGTLQINDDTQFIEQAEAYEAATRRAKPAFLGSGDQGTLAWVFEVCRFDDFLFVVTGGAVVVLDVQTGQWLDTWDSMHEQSVTSVVCFPPRGYLLTSSNDCTVKVWSLNANLKPPVGDPFRQPGDETITLVKTFDEHKDAVKQIAIHPNISLELLVSCSHDCSVRVFHLGTLTEVYRLELGDPVAGIHISNDDSVAIFSGKNVSIWTLTQVYRHFAKCMSKPLAIHRVHPIVPRAVTGGKEKKKGYESDPWLMDQLGASPAQTDGRGTVAKMPKGRRMRMDSQYDEWRTQDEKELAVGTPRKPPPTAPADDEAAPAAAAVVAPGAEPTVPPTVLEVEPDLEPEAELTADQSQCLTVVAAHSVRLLTADGQNVCSCILKDDGEVVAVCFDRATDTASSHKHVEAFILTSMGTIWIYNLPTDGQHEEDILQDRKWLHTADMGAVCLSRHLCSAPIRKQRKVPPGSPVKSAPLKDGEAGPAGSKFVLVGTDEGVVMALNHEGSGKVVRTQKCHRWAILQVEWLEQAQRVVTVCKDGCGVWDDRTLAPIRSISMGEDQSLMNGVTLVAANGMIVTADVEHHTLWTCDALGRGSQESFDVLGVAHPDKVTSIDYNVDRELFLSASIDGNVKVMAAKSWSVLRDVKLGRDAQAACFLNARGDIALGTGHSLSFIPSCSAYLGEKTKHLRGSIFGTATKERVSKDTFKAVDEVKTGSPMSIFGLTQAHIGHKIDIREALLKEQQKEEIHAKKMRPRQPSNFELTTFPSKESVVLSTSTLNVLARPRMSSPLRPVGLTPRGMNSTGMMGSTGGLLSSRFGSPGRSSGRDGALMSTSAFAMAPPATAGFLHNVVPQGVQSQQSQSAAETLTGFMQGATTRWFARPPHSPAGQNGADKRDIDYPSSNLLAKGPIMTVAEQARQPVIGPDGRLPPREASPRRSERHPGVSHLPGSPRFSWRTQQGRSLSPRVNPWAPNQKLPSLSTN